MNRTVATILAAVLAVMITGFTAVILLTRQDSDSEPSGPDPREVACITAGGEWTPNPWGGGRCKSESELREQERREFCSNLPARMRHADIPEKCLDFYEPVSTTR